MTFFSLFSHSLFAFQTRGSIVVFWLPFFNIVQNNWWGKPDKEGERGKKYHKRIVSLVIIVIIIAVFFFFLFSIQLFFVVFFSHLELKWGATSSPFLLQYFCFYKHSKDHERKMREGDRTWQWWRTITVSQFRGRPLSFFPSSPFILCFSSFSLPVIVLLKTKIIFYSG